jgi:hypothetical protein
MDALYIILLVFGSQAAAAALAMTIWLLRIGAMPGPRVELPVLSRHTSGPSSWAPAPRPASLTVLPGLEGTVEGASGHPSIAA